MELFKKYYLPWHFPFRKEIAGIIVIIALFLLFPYLIREVDRSAAAIDPGILSAIILAISAILIFKAGTCWPIKVIWPVFAEYSVRHFEYNFKSMQNMQKVWIYLGFYLSVFYAFVIVLAALI